MSLEERRKMIENLILDRGELELGPLADQFSVSEMTIRRDLEALESQGVLRRLAGGGAIALEGKSQEPALMARAMEASGSKTHIGAAVANLLRPREAVYFDGGSTVLAVARASRGRNLGLTVFTRSLLVALELAEEPETDVYILGGRLKPGEMMSVLSRHSDELNDYNVDTFVMGISGVHPARGLTDYDPEEAVGKRAAINQSDRVILAFDQSKAGRVFLARVGTLDEVDIVVTDTDANNELISAFPPTTEIHHV